MVESLIVALIVGGAAWYAGRKYLPAKWVGRKTTGCGSGCDTCSRCDNVPVTGKYPVIKLLQKR